MSKTFLQCENLMLYDWFSFTSKIDDALSIIQLLGIDTKLFRTVKGARGYLDREYFMGISIHHGGRDEVWCEMSGTGCRAFETYGNGAWDTLFELCSGKDYHVTRLDVAFDDHSGVFNLETLYKDCTAKHFVSKFTSWQATKSSEGITIYHGSPKSDVRFRIYDKARERNRVDAGHWVRFEIQMRDDRAQQFINLMILQTVGEVFTGVINNYLRYVKPTDDSNNRRWPTQKYWSKFIGCAGKLSLYVNPGIEYNILNLENFVVNQAGAASGAYISIVGEDAYIEKCREKFAQTRNEKYNRLVKVPM